MIVCFVREKGTVIRYRDGWHRDLVEKRRQIAPKDQMCDRAMAIPAVESYFGCINTKYPFAVRRRHEVAHWVPTHSFRIMSTTADRVPPSTRPQ